MAGEPITVEAVPAGPAPVPPQTPPMDESAVRAAVMQAEASGQEVVNAPTQTLDPNQSATGANGSVPAPKDTPAKFINPDGTVDVQKILDSSRQLDAGIQQKQLSIEEAIAQYKAKEAEFRGLPSNPAQIQRVAQQHVQAQPQPQPPAPPMAVPPDALHAQIMAEYQRDPIGTMVDLVKAVTANQQKPVVDFIEQLRERERDNGIKSNLSQLAQDDPRVLHPQVYAEIVKELESDPAYWQLRNPHKAAWNEVKGRLRLGEAQTPAQPGRTATPILGGGTPPPVPSSASGQATPQNLMAAIGQIKTSDERARVEAEIRRLMESVGM